MKAVTGALLCAAALVTGCGTVSGEAQPEATASAEPAFDPCDDIPDDAIRAVGLDPATESRDILGVHQPGWNVCAWNSSRVTLSVYTGRGELDTVRSNPDFVAFEEVDVNGQPGLAYRHAAYENGERCYASTSSVDGLLTVAVTVISADDGDPCARAHEAATVFLPFVTN